ncbi:MAG: helix-turn-helix domain-containing protein [Candidatus Pacearchaeota archaeon]
MLYNKVVTKMAINNELIKKVKDYFDLNIYETKVWLSLLHKGISSAGEISDLSGVPRSRTYDVLESLEKKGFVLEKIGKPIKYLAVKPSIVIEKLKNNLMKETKEKIQILEKLKETKEYEEIANIHQKGFNMSKTDSISSAIKGKNNLYSQLRDLLENAEEKVYFTSSAFEINTKLRMFQEIFSKLKKRNVDIKVIIPEEEEQKKLSKKLGIEIKARKINGRFLIIDKREVLFMVKPINEKDDDKENAFWINSNYFANSLAYLFELAWKD